jgi:protein-disulfide isomerase
MEKILADMASLLRESPVRPSPPPAAQDVAPFDLNIADAATKGAHTAKLALIEFSDFQCPFCGRHAKDTYPLLQKNLVDSGQLKYVFRNFPIEHAHPEALKAAEAAECGREQGRFWEMHDLIFANQQAIAVSDLFSHAQSLGIDQSQFRACLDGNKMTARVRQELAEARRLGVTATPTFFLGEIGKNGTVRVTKKIVGSHPLEVFQTAFQSILPAPPGAK